MIRDITIHAVLNGFIVTVGCQTLVFQSPDALATELLHYLNAPNATEDYYLKHSVNTEKLGLQPNRPQPFPVDIDRGQAGQTPNVSEQPSMQPQATR